MTPEQIVDALLDPAAWRGEENKRKWFRYLLDDIANTLKDRNPEIGPIQVILGAAADKAAFKFPRYMALLYIVSWGRLSGWADGESDPAEGWVSLYPTPDVVDVENEDEGHFEIENTEMEMGGDEGLMDYLQKVRREKSIARADQAANAFIDREFGSIET